MIVIAILLMLYVLRTRRMSPESLRGDLAASWDSLPPWIGGLDRGSAPPVVPSAEAFDREIRKILVAAAGDTRPSAATRPAAFDPYA
jgi:hypothetical protein